MKNKKKPDFIASRLKALNKLSYFLDMNRTTNWDFTAISKIFVETVGYKSSWIALIDEQGNIKKFSNYISKELITTIKVDFNSSYFENFINEALVHAGDVIYDEDPILDYFKKSDESDSLNSITIKLIYNNIIYGILSICLEGNYESVKEEVLLIADFVKTISFFLYDIDNRDKMINIFLTMFETTGNATALFDEDTMISYVNKEFEILSGCTKEEIENKKSFTEFVVEDDKMRMLEYHRLRRIDSSRAPRNYEFGFIDKHGIIKNIYMTIDLVPNSKISIASFTNITDRKRLESKILKISEQERQAIGTDLHDGLGPHLVGIKFLIKILKNKIISSTMPELSDVEEIDSLIGEAIEQTRNISRGLKPVDIQPDGLVFAIKDLTEKVESIFNCSCKLNFDDGFIINDNIIATHLFYIIQEAVNNAIKHANPKNIVIDLLKENNYYIIRISDDGSGIPEAFDYNEGLGLNIMQYRADIIKAGFEIKKNEMGGTTVVCSLENPSTD